MKFSLNKYNYIYIMKSIKWLFVILIVTGLLCLLIPLKEAMKTKNNCPTGCTVPKKLSGNCSVLKKNADGSYYKDCPYECTKNVEGGCVYDNDCKAGCQSVKMEGLWDEKGNVKGAVGSLTGESILLKNTGGSSSNSELSEEECAKEATRRGLKIGGKGYPFAGDYGCNGCYTYRRGEYKGIAYYGREKKTGSTSCSVNAVSIENPADAAATPDVKIGGNDLEDADSGPAPVSEEGETGFPSSDWDAPLDDMKKGCKLPSNFGVGVIGIGQNGCKMDSKLDPGQICDIGCEEKYHENKSLRGAYKCSKESVLKEHNLKCRSKTTPQRITAAFPQNDDVTVNLKIGKSKFTELISFFKEVLSKERVRQPRRNGSPPSQQSGEVIPPGDRQRQKNTMRQAHDDASASQAMSGTHDGYRHDMKKASAWSGGKFPGRTGADANENPYDSIMSISPGA